MAITYAIPMDSVDCGRNAYLISTAAIYVATHLSVSWEL